MMIVCPLVSDYSLVSVGCLKWLGDWEAFDVIISSSFLCLCGFDGWGLLITAALSSRSSMLVMVFV